MSLNYLKEMITNNIIYWALNYKMKCILNIFDHYYLQEQVV